jgi:hypothetical protein
MVRAKVSGVIEAGSGPPRSPVSSPQSRPADGLADFALVQVGGGRVDVAVPGAECRLDGGHGLVGRGLEDPEAEGGHRHAVVEFECVVHPLDARSGGANEGGPESPWFGRAWVPALPVSACSA